MNKNIETVRDGKLFYAVALPFQGEGETKLILHEAKLEENGAFGYGFGDTLIVDPNSVLLIKKQETTLEIK